MDNSGFKIISVVSARSGVGKTSFISSLVEKLSRAGLSVAVIKHIHHGFPDIDESKDTERMYLSGAKIAVAYGRETSLILVRNANLEKIIEALELLAGRVDIIIAEGFRGQVTGEKVFLISDISDVEECLRVKGEGSLIAVIATSSDIDSRLVEERGCGPLLTINDGLDLVYNMIVNSVS
ncbi:MAG: molybdopterin-guanine dinucleotide biosynthesis protein MobB [Desulfurococcales archaeon]|nr:molybdopterin-guanine dinucleotide biosynthesis protein MobB [Desulfurococcales archaeon]